MDTNKPAYDREDSLGTGLGRRRRMMRNGIDPQTGEPSKGEKQYKLKGNITSLNPSKTPPSRESFLEL